MTNKEFMAKVAKEIIHIKIDCGKSFNYVNNQFYDIMRKYNINRGTRDKKSGGIIQDNFEWTMCRQLFLSCVHDYYTTSSIFEGVPKDLECY